MANVISGHGDVLILLRARNSGWCLYAGHSVQTASEILEGVPAAGIADDEGLLEWFAEQLALPVPDLQARPPNPGPAAKPAEDAAAPPPVDAYPIPPVNGEVFDALQPFVKLARAKVATSDMSVLANEFDDATGEYTEVDIGDLRALIRAAGLWTSDMQAPQAPIPGPAEAAGDSPDAPAASSDADAQDGDDDADQADASADGDLAGITNADDREDPF